jgi:hypothetical protein
MKKTITFNWLNLILLMFIFHLSGDVYKYVITKTNSKLKQWENYRYENSTEYKTYQLESDINSIEFSIELQKSNIQSGYGSEEELKRNLLLLDSLKVELKKYK